MGPAMAAEKLKASTASVTSAPLTSAATLILNADSIAPGLYCVGAVLESIPLRDVVSRRSRAALYPARRFRVLRTGPSRGLVSQQ